MGPCVRDSSRREIHVFFRVSVFREGFRRGVWLPRQGGCLGKRQAGSLSAAADGDTLVDPSRPWFCTIFSRRGGGDDSVQRTCALGAVAAPGPAPFHELRGENPFSFADACGRTIGRVGPTAGTRCNRPGCEREEYWRIAYGSSRDHTQILL